jgi:hypothetical protein
MRWKRLRVSLNKPINKGGTSEVGNLGFRRHREDSRRARRARFGRPATWALLIALALGAVTFTVYQSRKTYPLESTDLRMTREQALAKARRLESRLHLGPKGYDQAASFYGADDVQSYIEQNAGGAVAFKRLTDSGDYSPITWSVRHFKQKQQAETQFEFSPKGDLYGFWVTLNEDTRGPALKKADALKIAVRGAAEFGVDAAGSKLVHSEPHDADSGRRDWTFDYERPDPRLRDASFSISLYVNGDDFAGFYQTIDVPKSFYKAEDRLDETRAVILGVVGLMAGLLFVIGGGFALLILARRRQFEWRRALGWGAIVAAVSAAAQLNSLPVNWFDYDTYDSKTTFLLQQGTHALMTFLGTWAFAAAALLVAEGLTRQAFPGQIQLWRVWRGKAASSKAVFGRTAGGYLWAAVLLGYVVAFYLLMTKNFSWYANASPTADPDMLATYLPWLGPLSMALEAGVLEEALFRALPLAGAVLLGRRFGHRKLFVGLGLVAEALVFAGAHASYPTEPVYARIVELFLPALIMGAIYLAFGLVPVIIAHFSYDYVLMGMPLFTTQHSSPWAKAWFVAVGLIPLAVVGVARLKARSWTEAGEGDLNRGWRPPRSAPAKPDPETVPMPGRRAWATLAVVGLLGFGGWFATLGTSADAPAMQVDAAQAEQRATNYLEGRGFDLRHFRPTTTLAAEPDLSDDYVLQTYGERTYRSLQGTYLSEPGWSVRFGRKDGTRKQRREWYEVTVGYRGTVGEMTHHLPEQPASWSKLTRKQAVEAGLAAVHDQLGLNLTPKGLSRADNYDGDWFIEFKDPRSPLKPGEAFIGVDLSSTEVSTAYRYVSVPDSYYQATDDASSQASLFSDVAGPAAGAAAGAVGLFVLIALARRRVSKRVFCISALTILLVNTVSMLNNWRSLSDGMKLDAAHGSEIAGLIFGAVLWSAILGLGLGLLNGAAAGMRGRQPRLGLGANWMLGVPLGAFFAGVVLPALGAFAPRGAVWPDYSAFQTQLPQVAGLDRLTETLAAAGLAAVVFGLINRYTGGWRRNRLRAALLITLISAAAMFQSAGDSVAGPALAAALLAVLAVISAAVVFRRSLAAAVPAAATATILMAISLGAAPAFPASRAMVAIGCIVTAAFALIWTGQLSRPLPATFGKRRSRADFKHPWRRAAWAQPFARRLPAIDDRLFGQLRSITRASRRARVTPCKLVMKDGSVHERVYLAEASSYLTAWSQWPDDDEQTLIDIEQVERIEASPHRLPASIGRKVLRRCKRVGGQRFFKLKLKGGTTIHCSTPSLADFVQLPEGVGVDDVVAVRREKRRSEGEPLPQAPHCWCLYRDPGRIYPDVQPAPAAPAPPLPMPRPATS